ncbi:phosphoserine phosphatase [Arsenicicoccus sp. oral taxon 190]|nr:phosphoserine phosphatase [Arsenicicoccus sp. oral taxon 190]
MVRDQAALDRVRAALQQGPGLLVTDVDSTLIQDEVIELLAAHAATEPQVRAVTEAAMRGELDFAASLHARVATLAGLDEAVLAQVGDAVRLTPGADVLVRSWCAAGGFVGVVSGGFVEVVEPLAEELGIHHAHANALEVVDGRLTGRVLGDVVDRAAKARSLREWAARHDIPLERTVAVGDGANDLDLLAAAGLGVAFAAKPALAERADVCLPGPRLDDLLDVLGMPVTT